MIGKTHLIAILLCTGFISVAWTGTKSKTSVEKPPSTWELIRKSRQKKHDSKPGEYNKVSELLDKYAATQDNLQSFILKSETSQTTNYTAIRTIVEPRAITEVRYDGDRCFVEMLQWGKRRINSKEFIPKKEADCVRYLWDGKWSLTYTDSEKGAEYDKAIINMSRKSHNKSMSTSLDYGSFLRGFLHGGKKGRIDSILRKENSTSVRTGMEKIGESDCYVIEADTKHGKYTLWVDPSHGYNIAKAEIQRSEIQYYNNRNGNAHKDVRQSVSMKDIRFKKVQDVWIPVEGHIESGTYSPGRDVLQEVHHVVTDIILNPDHDALGSFDTDFIRNGALVIVRGVKGITYRWQGGKIVDTNGKIIIDCSKRTSEGENNNAKH